MKIYLAGAMTGIPDFNYPAFKGYAAKLRAEGHEVYNPIEITPETGLPFESYMAADLPYVCKCDAVALIPGWSRSRGVALELKVARALGKKIMCASTGAILAAPESNIAMGEATEERITDPKTGGAKGSKLARFDLIPPAALWALAEHYGKGEKKYPSPKPGIANWQQGYRWSLSVAALMRHLTAWLKGEDIDDETGSHHMIAVAWHAFALFWFGAHRPEHDDRTCTAMKNITPKE